MRAVFCAMRAPWLSVECWCPSTICRLFKPLGCLASPHRHHEGFIYDDSAIRSRVSFSFITECNPVFIRQTVLCLLPFVFKDSSTGSCIRERNIDTFLETTTDSIVKFPGDVGSTENQDAVHAVADTLHLYQEFCLDSS